MNLTPDPLPYVEARKLARFWNGLPREKPRGPDGVFRGFDTRCAVLVRGRGRRKWFVETWVEVSENKARSVQD